MDSDIKSIKEKLRIASLLAVNAGFIDAYTFFHFQGRFAGAQTGNLVQAGIALAQGNWQLTGNFLMPILFFMVGIAFKTVVTHIRVKHKLDSTTYLLWVQLIFIWLFVTFYSAFFQVNGTLEISILSFIMAIQMNNFTVTHGLGYGSIFSTANMRSFAQGLVQYGLTRDKADLKKAGVYFSLVFSFLTGAVMSTWLQYFFAGWTLYGSVIILVIVIYIFHSELVNMKKYLLRSYNSLDK
ncbi:YoaK family protein [Lactovum miscens]|uniref:Uncharacterized membrane protein YoaK (UPF0700 family) n=1 Tax=Lactovum miscens TaxID=190387 RepID=A0A841CB54_9LACT|nr:YoaK family protein [Lactovum miscens]MBB5888782.1 uncharacterized membrane protein YoaK (UPF0700 family) [Lactovum miscens]